MSNKKVQGEYYRLHSCCPKCGHSELETTCMGQILPPKATLNYIHDYNIASCGCGWKGEVHSMIPKFRAKVFIKREIIDGRPGLFELEVYEVEGILPSKYNIGSVMELVLDEQA